MKHEHQNRDDEKTPHFSPPDFHFSSIFHNPMLSRASRSIRAVQRGCIRFAPPALIRGASTGKTENPNHPTPLSIEKLKYYAESQDNMPVRLSLAKFISTELPIRFAVTSLFAPSRVGDDVCAELASLPAVRYARHDRFDFAVQPLPGRDHEHEDSQDDCGGHRVHRQIGPCPARSAARVPAHGCRCVPAEAKALRAGERGEWTITSRKRTR